MILDSPFVFTLNTSTLRPFALSVPDQIRVAAGAGYKGIELWLRDVVAYADAGGNLADLKAIAEDVGVRVINGIAMSRWTDVNPEIRAAELEQARAEMDVLARLGCPAIAAPPAGNVRGLTIETLGANFAALLSLGESMGVEPVLEFWSHAAVVRTISDAIKVLDAAGAGAPPDAARFS